MKMEFSGFRIQDPLRLSLKQDADVFSKNGMRMCVSAQIVGVLARAAAEKVREFPVAERIKIYHALGESMPNDAARAAAMELARVLSQAAALELNFQEQLRTRKKGQIYKEEK